MALSAVTDLDEDEITAYAEAVQVSRRQDQWGYTQELLAEILQLQHATVLAIRRGMPVVNVRHLRHGRTKPVEVKRPAWMGEGARPGEVVLTSVRGLKDYLH